LYSVITGIKPTEKAELSVMKYIFPQSQSFSMFCMTTECLVNVIVRSERDLSAAILVAKFTCIEKLGEEALIFNKYHSN